MKTLGAGIQTEITNRQFVSCELVELGLATPLFLSTAIFDVVTSTDTSGGSQTYLAQGNFLNFTSVIESEELKINNVSINFSGASSTFVNIVLNESYLHRTIRIYRVWFNTSTGAIIDSPLLVYMGTITGASVSDSTDESTVSLVTSNHFYDFERTAGRKTNPGSQKRFFPGDEGFRFSTAELADIRWGRV